MGTIHRPDETFLRFWDAYPRHVAKYNALLAWCKLDPPPVLVEEILEALKWQRALWPDPQFIPYAATYIRSKRWTDEKPTTTSLNNSSRQDRSTQDRAAPVMTRLASLGVRRNYD